ncbi:hypothetical protein FRC07_000141 [Ceratobasidium sp. 392]|nr:hypothetical protein FRC07_000141 [Ceratobasidium sp. 392]
MSNRHRPRQQAPTTLIVPPTHSALAPTPTASVFGTNTATELATNALPTQLVFDSSAVTAPLGVATDGNAATISVSPIMVGTVDPKSAVPVSTSTPPSDPSSIPTEATLKTSSKNDLPIAAIIMAIVAAAAIGALFLFLWYRKRARRRGHTRSSSHGADPGPVLRKLGPGYNEKPSSSDPFSDDHASSAPEDPFADPEKAYAQASHNRSGSDSFLSMSGGVGGMPRQPYAHHAASASTGSTASSKIRRKEAEEVRNKDLAALNNLVRALDHKERKAELEGRERRSLPPVELFKAALVR